MTRATIDTNIFSPAASTGKAAVITDPANAFWTAVIANVNEHASALDTIGAPSTGAPTETKTTGAATLTTLLTRLSISGTKAFSLADGTTDGQVKQFECTVASSTPVGTLTVATMDTAGGGVNATFVFDTVGQVLWLQWTGAAWHIIKLVTAGQVAVVVATTVLTGRVMNSEYALSVTGTVAGSTTTGIPNGRYPGQRLHIMTPTAAILPSGSLSIVATTTSCQAQFEWDGVAWQCQSLTTATLS